MKSIEQNTSRCLKTLEEETAEHEENFELRLRPRPSETVSLQIPVDALAFLKRAAASRDMSYQALMKFYIGQGLRQDLAKLYADRALERVTETT